jgi:hypothetical protein
MPQAVWGSLLVLATLLPLGSGCDTFFAGFITPAPANCVVSPDACMPDQICNQQSRLCEPRIDCRNTPALCTNLQVCNQQTGSCDAIPLPPRLPSLGGVCLGSAMCWENPFPQGNDLYAVWGNGPSDMWAAGQYGTVIRYDGTNWTGMVTGSQAGLRGIWGTGSSNMWTVGNGGTILHWDGTSWKTVSSPTTQMLRSVWGTSPGNAWTVGTGGTILRWNGSAWTPENSGLVTNLDAVAGSGPTDIWASGNAGGPAGILHSDGTTWSLNTTGGMQELEGIWVLDAQNAWMVGFNGHIRPLNAGSWATLDTTPTTNTLYAVAAASKTSAFAGGAAGTLLQWNGTTWQAASWQGSPPSATQDLHGAWFDGSSTTWIVGLEGVIAQATTSPTVVSRGQGLTLQSVWGTAGDNAWAVGNNGLILHRQPGGWLPESSGTTVRLNRVFGYAGGSVFAVGVAVTGMNSFLIRAGGAWTAVPQTMATGQGKNLDSIWGTDEHNTWAVGSNGLILKYDTGTLTVQNSQTTVHLHGIHGTSPTDVWAVGDSGVVLHYDGTAWSIVPVTGAAMGATLLAVWARSTTEAWAVGQSGAALHYDGTSWQTVGAPVAAGNNLYDVHGLAATGQVIAVSDAGSLLRWNQGAWMGATLSTGATLEGVYLLDASNCWVVGTSGTILNIAP